MLRVKYFENKNNLNINELIAKRTGCFVVVDTNSFQLQITVTVVNTGWINAMFVGNYFPELERIFFGLAPD